VIDLHVRKDIERSDLRAEKLERRPILVFLELLSQGIRIGEDLQPLFFGRGELRLSQAGALDQEPRCQDHDQDAANSTINALHRSFAFCWSASARKPQ
jgi:hypothetical protein